MRWVKLTAIDRILPQSNKFAIGVENKATYDSKRNDSPAQTVPYFFHKIVGIDH